MENQAARLSIEVTVQEPGTIDRERNVVVRSPTHDVREKRAAVADVVARVAAIDICREIRDAPAVRHVR